MSLLVAHRVISLRMYSGKVEFLPTLVEAHTNQPISI
jgi:hypothetical protein